MINNLSIKEARFGLRCDYCWIDNKKVVSMPEHEGGDTRDICMDCVLEIYEFAKKEILW